MAAPSANARISKAQYAQGRAILVRVLTARSVLLFSLVFILYPLSPNWQFEILNHRSVLLFSRVFILNPLKMYYTVNIQSNPLILQLPVVQYPDNGITRLGAGEPIAGTAPFAAVIAKQDIFWYLHIIFVKNSPFPAKQHFLTFQPGSASFQANTHRPL